MAKVIGSWRFTRFFRLWLDCGHEVDVSRFVPDGFVSYPPRQVHCEACDASLESNR